MKSDIDISIIFVNYNVFDYIYTAVNAIHRNLSNVSYEIVLVDNNFPDREVENVTSIFPDIKFIKLKRNTAFANNRTMEVANGRYLLLMNPNIIVRDNSIKDILDYIEKDKSVGVIGPIQINPNKGYERYYSFSPTFYSRLMQEIGLYTKTPGMKKKFSDFWDINISKNELFDVDWIIGSFMLVRKEVFEKTGGFGEAFFLFEEEVEWEQRIAVNGWRRAIIPSAKVLHDHHSSISKLSLD